jgi:Protein of unknown function DUF72
MGKLQIGTSGWVYKHWMDIFYPPHLPSDQQLSFYAQRFSTVEINFSFYKLPERFVFETWRSPSLQKPPKELVEAMGMPIPPALQTARNRAETEAYNN